MSVFNKKKKINYNEPKLVENHIGIIGVPEEANEDCGKIANEISMALGVTVCVANSFRFRSKVRNKQGKIAAVRKNYENKIILMDMTRKKKLKANNINTNWNDLSIYIYNYLTQTNSNLFYKNRCIISYFTAVFVRFFGDINYLFQYDSQLILVRYNLFFFVKNTHLNSQLLIFFF